MRSGPHTHHLSRQARDVHLGAVGVLRRRNVQKDRRILAAGTAQDAAVTSDGDIAAGPRVHLGNLARCENALVGHQHNTGAIAARLIRPSARCDPIDGINDVARTIVADRPVRALRGMPHSGTGVSSSRLNQ